MHLRVGKTMFERSAILSLLTYCKYILTHLTLLRLGYVCLIYNSLLLMHNFIIKIYTSVTFTSKWTLFKSHFTMDYIINDNQFWVLFCSYFVFIFLYFIDLDLSTLQILKLVLYYFFLNVRPGSSMQSKGRSLCKNIFKDDPQRKILSI